MNIRKVFKNKSGDIWVRSTLQMTGACGIVEFMHMNSKDGKSGYVVGYWEKRMSDGDPIAEFIGIHDRMVKVQYDDAQILLDALTFGQKLADLLVIFSEEK